MRRTFVYLLALGLLWTTTAMAAPTIEVEALMTNTAVLKIDGERKTLRAGETYKGVTLISAYSRTATLEVDGKQMVVGISRRIGADYQQPSEQVVTIRRDARLQYNTNATINGRSMPVLVDTGANLVALSSVHAKKLAIDYQTGVQARVETASGMVNAWVITLRSVSVGGIRVENVEATVVEGSFPNTVLLGMSYLKHVDIKESNGVLSLSRAW
ncbi:MAG: TIGR02281 family clan AA aspartic protease [Haliea sp.]|jgi:aspartyl protease family protein|nr:TIGR02281 family clan AA aspartic protease [Haliea sp.]